MPEEDDVRKDSFWLMLCDTKFRVGTIVVGPVVRQRIMECDGGEGEEGKLRGGRRGKRERRGERERRRDGVIRLGTSYAFRVHLQ